MRGIDRRSFLKSSVAAAGSLAFVQGPRRSGRTFKRPFGFDGFRPVA